ncbi:Integrase-like, catalytic domain [Phytophthora cactorum]|nr:Integrase-like, catalytic domain [Phytophthora cactorum]
MASSNSRAQLVVSPPGSVGAPILSEILSSHIVDEENTITDADSRSLTSIDRSSRDSMAQHLRELSVVAPSFTTYARPSPTGNVYHPTCNRLAAHLTPADQLMSYPTSSSTSAYETPRNRLYWGGSVSGLLLRAAPIQDCSHNSDVVPLVCPQDRRRRRDRRGGQSHAGPEPRGSSMHPTGRSKTNQSGPQVMRILSRSGHPLFRPVLGALLLLRSTRNLPVAVLMAVFTDKHGASFCVTSARVAQAIQSTARSMGEDPRRYIRHSLRAGGATNIYRAGIDVQTIKFHGRNAARMLFGPNVCVVFERKQALAS